MTAQQLRTAINTLEVRRSIACHAALRQGASPMNNPFVRAAGSRIAFYRSQLNK